jgi:hypothetical protein
VVANVFHPSTCEAEVVGFLSSRPAWYKRALQESQRYTEIPSLQKLNKTKQNKKTKKQKQKKAF